MTQEQEARLKRIYGEFKTITSELDTKTVSPEFWKKESENILKYITKSKKMKESMKMSPEKFRQEFTI